MLFFSKLTLDDLDKIASLLNNQNIGTCDYTIGGLYIWRDYFNTEFAFDGETLFFKINCSYHGITAFSYPLGGNLEEAVGKIIEYCHETKNKLYFCGVTKEQKDELEALDMLQIVEILEKRDIFDYVYNPEDMIHFVGKKFAGQRNHINKFKSLYPDFTFEVIDDTSDFEAIKNFCNDHLASSPKQNEALIQENIKIIEVLDNWTIFKMYGGILKVNGKIIALSIGETINDTMYIHVEKADISYPGVYQIIVSQFAGKFVTPEVKFINREDDTGDLGLRTSKLSYHPVKLIEKYTVETKN